MAKIESSRIAAGPHAIAGVLGNRKDGVRTAKSWQVERALLGRTEQLGSEACSDLTSQFDGSERRNAAEAFSLDKQMPKDLEPESMRRSRVQTVKIRARATFKIRRCR